MRVLGALIGILVATVVSAAPQQRIRAELAQVDNPPVRLRVGALAKPLRHSLGRAFRNPHLDMASAGEPVRENPGVIIGDPASEAEGRRPSRRLIFAFETPSFYVVYYEHRTPVAGAALIFSKARDPKLIWGGIDFHEPWAKSPQALSSRILRNRLDDSSHPYW